MTAVSFVSSGLDGSPPKGVTPGMPEPTPNPTVLPVDVEIRQNDQPPPINFTGSALILVGRTVSQVKAFYNGQDKFATLSNITNTGFTATFPDPFTDDPATIWVLTVTVSDPAVPGGWVFDGGTIEIT